MSIRAKTLLNLYRRGKIQLAGVKKAVADGVISTTEFETITGETYE